MISYQVEREIDPAAVADLFRRSGIRRPVEDLDRIGRMIHHANLILCAWDGEKLVAIARALTDFSYCCYLSDLAVDRAYQKQGIGKGLVDRIKDIVGEEVMILLLSAPEAESYYPHLGFEKAENAWRIPRRR
ncbi:GNAT family N-acetyltransferase [Candidatus Manganitrophus noduliformans]|uniref:GNAT family N-acetyltransferase n=1 Tax=Candidatus Manganitrophus noduliformans TaxID=2606439 RepID=A0A7X6DMI6_9BACT|nr:GNAT family N-acetyltransferase [Candidatus Manganitrophus noduliformans]NKE69961.1 GNAT family N-acetyltransferase [Candidatus Manganitrophus noduliformans]